MIGDERVFFRSDWPIIEIRSGASISKRTHPIDLDKLEPLRNDKLPAAACAPAILNRMLQIEQCADVLSVIAVVNQHGTALHQVAIALQDQINRGIKQRVTGTQICG